MGNLYDEGIWQLPEMYDYAREAVIPKPNRPLPSPWTSIDRIMSYSRDGKATGLVTRVLQVARKQNRLAALHGEVQQALKTSPKWTGGEALLALLDAHRVPTPSSGRPSGWSARRWRA